MLRNLLVCVLASLALNGLSQPIFTEHPASQNVCPGQCAPLNVEAVGGGIVYGWYTVTGMDTTAIGGAAGTFFEYCDVDSAGITHSILCKATDSAGLVTWSNTAVIVVDSCLPPIADFVWEWNHLELCFTNTSQRANTVFWFFGDGSTDASNVDSVCHTYASKEIYYVTLQAFNEYDVDVVEKGINLLGADDPSIDPKLNLFPNPTKNTLHVESDRRIVGLEIYDEMGRLVVRESLNDMRIDRDVNHLDKGIYVVHIITDSARLTRRVVIE